MNLYRLSKSSLRIIQEEGFHVFVKLLCGWLAGKRGAYHPNKPLHPPITYIDFQRTIEPFTLVHNLPASNDLHFGIVINDFPGIDLTITHRSLQQQVYENWSYYTTNGANLSGMDQDYIVLMDAGDSLSPHALAIIAQAITERPDSDFIYSDYDELDVSGNRCNPFFKPDWSPEIMLSVNLMQHVAVCRREIWETIEWQGNNWDFALRVCEKTNKILHIPHVLYHRSQQHVEEPAVSIIVSHLERQGLKDPSFLYNQHGSGFVTWQVAPERRISIIIPSRDQVPLVRQCLSSLFNLTTYDNYEVILVDTGSVELETMALYDEYASNERFKLVHFREPFNFSSACNFGTTIASGELLLFLNNDTEILHNDWLHLMAQWFERPGIGIVGPKLLYPNGTIQHAGVVIGLHGLAGHILALLEEHQMTLFGSDDWYRNYLAVTGACLMISQEVFKEVGGFEEAYQLNYSDVELCIRAYEAGYRIVYTPHVRLIHHESATHQKQIPVEDTFLFNERLQPWLERGDPFYNPNLTYQTQIPDFKRNLDDTPYHHNKIMMGKVWEKIRGS